MLRVISIYIYAVHSASQFHPHIVTAYTISTNLIYANLAVGQKRIARVLLFNTARVPKH